MVSLFNTRGGRRIRATVLLTLLLFLVFGTEGCWSSRELGESALVAGAGFDYQEGKYILTLQILQPGKLTPKTRGQSARAVYVTQDSGRTVFEAIRTFPHQTTRKLYWSHCQVFILGRQMAEQSVTKTLNWFYRNQELRPLAYIGLSNSDAAAILHTKTHLNPIPAYDLAADIETLSDTSQAPIVTLMEFMKMTTSSTGAAFMPILDQQRITGTGVFLHDRLVGELNWDEGRGLLSLIGDVKSGKILVPMAGGSGSTSSSTSAAYSTLEIIQERVKQDVQFVQGRPLVRYHIRCTADLADDPGLAQHSTADLQKLEQAAAKQLTGQAVACINTAKAWHADIIGAGETIHRRAPQQWQALKSNWEQQFPHTAIEVTTEIHIRHEGLIRGRA